MENSILTEEDISEFLICVEKINNFSKNKSDKILKNNSIKDLPLELIKQFIFEFKTNDKDQKVIKSLTHYLHKYNEIKSFLVEIITAPELSLKKISKILNRSDFIINYNEEDGRYILEGSYYETSYVSNSNTKLKDKQI